MDKSGNPTIEINYRDLDDGQKAVHIIYEATKQPVDVSSNMALITEIAKALNYERLSLKNGEAGIVHEEITQFCPICEEIVYSHEQGMICHCKPWYEFTSEWYKNNEEKDETRKQWIPVRVVVEKL